MLCLGTGILAEWCQVAYSFNGIGTTYYGKRDFAADGSYVTTEWFVFIWLPIVPLRSLRVQESGSESRLLGWADTYRVLSVTSPNVRQVLFTYGFVASFAIGVYLLSLAISLRQKVLPLSSYPQLGLAIDAVAIGCWVALPLLPYVLRRIARARLSRARRGDRADL